MYRDYNRISLRLSSLSLFSCICKHSKMRKMFEERLFKQRVILLTLVSLNRQVIFFEIIQPSSEIFHLRFYFVFISEIIPR